MLPGMTDDPIKGSVKGAIEAIYKPIESIVKTLAGPAAEEIGLSLRDSVQAWRLKRQIRLFEQVKHICEIAGIKPQAVKMPLLFEIMEKGSLEEDDELQDIWANMLANAADPKRTSLVTTAFPEILKQLCRDEVVFLNGRFPNEYQIKLRSIYCDNLKRRGLVTIEKIAGERERQFRGPDWKLNEHFSEYVALRTNSVSLTTFGRGFVTACKRPEPQVKNVHRL